LHCEFVERLGPQSPSPGTPWLLDEYLPGLWRPDLKIKTIDRGTQGERVQRARKKRLDNGMDQKVAAG
jgi:hypothetical protein